MFPVLFDFGPFTIYTYGFFVALGVIVSIFFARHEARRIDVDPDRIMDLCFYLVVAAIVGSRLLYVAINLDHFAQAPLDVFKIWSGGLVFYGGFIGALIVALAFIRFYRMPLAKIADIAGMTIPLGHFFGRMGCFFAGCCYGETCRLPWAVTFHHAESLAPTGIPLHPTQLYSALANLGIFGILFALRERKTFDGQLFWVYIIGYGLTRSLIEVFRGDYRGGFLFDTISMSQAIGLSLAVLAAIVLIIYTRKHRRAGSSAGNRI